MNFQQEANGGDIPLLSDAERTSPELIEIIRLLDTDATELALVAAARLSARNLIFFDNLHDGGTWLKHRLGQVQPRKPEAKTAAKAKQPDHLKAELEVLTAAGKLKPFDPALLNAVMSAAGEIRGASETGAKRRRANRFFRPQYDMFRKNVKSGEVARMRAMLAETLCALKLLRKSSSPELRDLRTPLRAIHALHAAVEEFDESEKRDLSFRTAERMLDLPLAFPSWTRRASLSGQVKQDGGLIRWLENGSPLDRQREAASFPGRVLEAQEKCKSGRQNDVCSCDRPHCCMPQNPACVSMKSYVMDLMTVQETLDCYEAGELAFIQNVMQGETIERTHTTLTETEDFEESETSSRTAQETEFAQSERFELQHAVQTTVSQDLAADAGITVSGSYGPAGSYSATANVAHGSARSEARQTARNYAKDLTQRAVTSLQNEVRNLHTSRSLRRVTDVNAHKLGATQSQLSGQYHWVNKRSVSQVMNWGKRMMYECVIPEPAALLKELMRRKSVSSDTIPPALVVDFDASAISEDPASPMHYRKLSQRFGLTDVPEPPIQSFFLHFNSTVPENSHSTVTLGTIPKNYILKSINTEIWGHGTILFFGSGHSTGTGGFGSIDMWFIEDTTVSVTVHNDGSIGQGGSSVGSGYAKVERSPRALETWQNKFFETIVAASEAREREREMAMAEREDIDLTPVTGQNPFLNREVERTQIWQLMVSLLTCQHFDSLGAMKRKVAPCGYPQLDHVQAKEEGALIQFFEQVFDVQQMMYLFYPYFWGDKCDWANNIGGTDPDALFARFLEAGAVRVTLPVRPGMAHLALHYEQFGEIWLGQGEPDYDPSSPHFLAMHAEVKLRSGNFSEDRPGLMDIDFDMNDASGAPLLDPNGTNLGQNRRRVAIKGTDFWWNWADPSAPGGAVDDDKIQEDIEREIFVARKSYRIVDIELDEGLYYGVQNVPTSAAQENDLAFVGRMRWIVTLERDVEVPGNPNHPHPTADLKYSVGAIFVGDGWEVTTPTSLIWLRPPGPDGYSACLPCYPVRC